MVGFARQGFLRLSAARRPELRRAFISLPWPHLWEAEESIAAVAIERKYCGEQGVFFGMLKAPNLKPLAELSASVRELKIKPVEEISISAGTALLALTASTATIALVVGNILVGESESPELWDVWNQSYWCGRCNGDQSHRPRYIFTELRSDSVQWDGGICACTSTIEFSMECRLQEHWESWKRC